MERLMLFPPFSLAHLIAEERAPIATTCKGADRELPGLQQPHQYSPPHFLQKPVFPQLKHFRHGPICALRSSDRFTSSKWPPRTSRRSSHRSRKLRVRASLPDGTWSVFVYPPKRYMRPVSGSVISALCARYVGKPWCTTCRQRGHAAEWSSTNVSA